MNDPYRNTFDRALSEDDPALQRSVGLVEWLSHNDGVYWINGKAGSGKSTLMKALCISSFVAEQLVAWANGSQLIVSYFFFHDRGTTLQKSQLGLMRGLLYRILASCTALIRIVCQERWAQLDAVFSGALPVPKVNFQLKDLSTCFTRIRKQKSVLVSICCFVDGLDENQGSDREILELLQDLRGEAQLCSEAAGKLKMCVSARPYSTFERTLYHCPQLEMQRYNGPDITRYVYEKLQVGEQILKDLRISRAT